MSTPVDDMQIPIISMREHIERVLDERDRLYDARFRASEISVNVALVSAEKSVNNAFAAQQTAMQTALVSAEKAVSAALASSDRAVLKAEIASDKRFDGLNELRGMVTDQQALFMQRLEAVALFKSSDDKLTATQISFDSKLDVLRASFEKSLDTIGKDIAGLRESRSESTGHSSGGKDLWGYMVAIAAIALTIIFHFVK